jgi:hypothetical protein
MPEILKSAIRRDGDRIDDHAALEALHFPHFFGLIVGRHIAVNDAHAARLSQSNGKAMFRDSIHGGGDQGNAEGDCTGKTRRCVDFRRQDGGRSWHQQDVIECQSFAELRHRDQ